MTLDYACDTKKTTGLVTWRDRVGTGEGQIVFGGWGEIEWGLDPWAEGEAVTRNFTTGPAVILRTIINADAATSTFLQPILMHAFAGEEINLQAISIDYEFVSSTSTR